MVCPNCGTQSADGNKFCTSCGTALAAPETDSAYAAPLFSEQHLEQPVKEEPVADTPVAEPLAEETPVAETPVQEAPAAQSAQWPAAQGYVPQQMPSDPPAKPKKEKRGTFGKLLPWLIVGVLVIGIAVAGFFVYQEYAKLTEERDELTRELASVKADMDAKLSEKDQALAGKEQELAEKNQALAQKDQALAEKEQELAAKDEELAALAEQNAAEHVYKTYYDDIVTYAGYGSFGGDNTYGVNSAVVTLSLSGSSTFQGHLKTAFNGKTITWYRSNSCADLQIMSDSWGEEGVDFTIKAEQPGITVLNFAVEDGSLPEFNVLVIITE